MFSSYRQNAVGPANEKRSESEFDDPRFFSAAFGKRSGSGGVFARYGPWGSRQVWNRQPANY
ncbi:hypothetical protein AAVH_04266 [Aphelenchoides avenae]|nr:hypothetical protein AAVH_41590 [Aphelenchus avenae]KAH7728022.1 hypothetical protein AAVH_04266 [Aphelenchus avenae]